MTITFHCSHCQGLARFVRMTFSFSKSGIMLCPPVYSSFFIATIESGLSCSSEPLPIGPYFYSLCNELFRKEAQRIQLQGIGEPEYHFLDAGCLQLGQALTDGIGTTDEIAVDPVPRPEPA